MIRVDEEGRLFQVQGTRAPVKGLPEQMKENGAEEGRKEEGVEKGKGLGSLCQGPDVGKL